MRSDELRADDRERQGVHHLGSRKVHPAQAHQGIAGDFAGVLSSQQNPLQETLGHAGKGDFRHRDEPRIRRRGLVHVREQCRRHLRQHRGAGEAQGARSPACRPASPCWTTCSPACTAANSCIIGARPSMGKTSFAMNIATHAALSRDTKASPCSRWKCRASRLPCVCSAPTRASTCKASAKAPCVKRTGYSWRNPSAPCRTPLFTLTIPAGITPTRAPFALPPPDDGQGA